MDPLTLPGTLPSLKEVRQYVTAAAAAAGLDKKATYRLRLAVDEIATNIITHGYQEAGLEGELELRADISDTRLLIAIEDSGAAYDPDLDEPDLDLPLEERQMGGLGVFLSFQNVDELHYEQTDDGRNRHTFIVKRNLPSPDE